MMATEYSMARAVLYSPDIIHRNCLAFVAPVVAATASIGRVGNQVPEGDEDGGPDQSAHEWDARGCGDVDVTDAGDSNDIGHQPDTIQRGNDCATEAKWEPPSYQGFREKTNNGRDNQGCDDAR